MAMTERQWDNVFKLFHRVVDHDWQDRALGTYAPKLSERETKTPDERNINMSVNLFVAPFYGTTQSTFQKPLLSTICNSICGLAV